MEASVSFKAGIPSATFVDHAGYTVPDLDQAVTFFTKVLGAELLYQAGPYQDDQSDSLFRILNVHPRTQVRLAALRLGPTNNVELVEMTSPEHNSQPPKLSDAGGRHLCFRVLDLDAAKAYLQAQPGVRVLETIAPDQGPEAGVTTTYFTSPWGMYFELITRPDNLPYEAHTQARLFEP